MNRAMPGGSARSEGHEPAVDKDTDKPPRLDARRVNPAYARAGCAYLSPENQSKK
jgi:hypothetical protein